MIKTVLILFSTLSMGSIYMTYHGIGQEGVKSIEPSSSVRSSSSSHGSSYGGNGGGFSFGK